MSSPYKPGFKLNPNMFNKLANVRHHLSKGRSAASIAVWENIPLSQVKLLIAQVNNPESR